MHNTLLSAIISHVTKLKEFLGWPLGSSRPGKIPQWFNLHGIVGHGYQGLVATSHAQMLLAFLCAPRSATLMHALNASWWGHGARPWARDEATLQHTWQR